MQLGEDGGLAGLLPDSLGGKLFESGGQGVGIAGFEEYQVFGRLDCAVFFDRKIHAVLAGHALKGFDIAVGNLNIGYARVLLDKLLDALLAVGNFRGFAVFLPCFQQLAYGLPQSVGRKSGCADDQRNRPVFDFFLNGENLLSAA